MAGGEIYGETYSIYNQENGNIIVSGGTLGTIYNYNENLNTIEITGGTIQTIDNKQGNIIVSEGTIKVIENDLGTVEISDGEVSESLENRSGNINITDGKIKNIYNRYGNGTINILGGTFELVSNEGTGVINIEGGNITNTSGNAVCNRGGIINIGKNDGEVIIEIPQIKSTSTYGVYNYDTSGKVNFYDGTIIGKGKAIYGAIKELEGYKIKREEKTIDLIAGLEVCTLEQKGDTTSQIRIDDNYFASLQDAIDSCMTGQEVIIIIEGNIIIEGKPIEITSDKIITINLNGFTISGPITNNGTLNIQNIVEGEQKEIKDRDYGDITNNGTLNVQQSQQ